MATSSPYYNAEAPVVIQGKAVDSNALLSVEGNGEWTRGEKQPGTCQDMFWAILFYAHLGAIGAVTAKYAPLMKEELAEGYADGYQNNGRRLSSISRFLEDNGGENQQEDAELVHPWNLGPFQLSDIYSGNDVHDEFCTRTH
jgi:hypothetical protein